MKLNELINDFEIWTTNEEKELLKKLQKPTRLTCLSEQDQFRVQSMIRKSLLTKIGHTDPIVVANERPN
jgi:DNA-directed RNA polymerase subunit H (RpoH/RPB5)